MHQKTILWGYVVDIVGHSQQYYLSGKPKTCLTSKHSRCQVLGQKCTSLFARCICTGRPPSPFPPLRHTSSWPGCLIFTASGCDRSTSCSVEPPPRVGGLLDILQRKTGPTKSRDQKDTDFMFWRHRFSKVSLAVRQIVAEAKQLKTRQSGRPSGTLPSDRIGSWLRSSSPSSPSSGWEEETETQNKPMGSNR